MGYGIENYQIINYSQLHLTGHI